MSSILVPVADGTEEIEAVTLVNILRRAELDVTVASVGRITIQGSRGIQITADKLLEDCQTNSYDGIFLPGGMPGATHLANSEILIKMLKTQKDSGRFYGAICASPAVVLAAHGLLADKKATCYPGFESALPDASLAQNRVVVDGNCITARGPGCSSEFALAVVAALADRGQAARVREQLIALEQGIYFA